ncbi:MAG: isoprenylcysteine carboxylmethyltransferase family protein [Deltaproteobacteria bacterium]|jgi:protein-S-isoprenylcysteine O-methyltransferase Ste14|nr:isoprenylcysteine carboxylmethyltransferase family protein [Deltaproteobacteria bacterium]MBW2335961.1 isoprenylcysteine carboxylmethyltransferase family protein [Deltaproteobacteria bacterium]MBW2582673.1 isoprenylcysteine carboxylmethyltransferase family protein [Deltaproteobacteria bacterium]
MEQKENDSADIRIPPPIFFFISLAFGLLLEYFLPIDINIPQVPRAIFGSIFIIISGYFAVSAFVVLINNKTTFDTSKSTTKIVTKGSFRISRNPLYFSLLLLLFGIAVLFFSIWLFLMVPVLYIVLLFKAVKPEERYLTQKFGKEYLEYSSKVRRWV